MAVVTGEKFWLEFPVSGWFQNMYLVSIIESQLEVMSHLPSLGVGVVNNNQSLQTLHTLKSMKKIKIINNQSIVNYQLPLLITFFAFS